MKDHQARLQQVIDSLTTEVCVLKVRLLSAQRRADAAEEHCQKLEVQLDFAGSLLPDEDQGTPSPGPAGRRDLEAAALFIRAYEAQLREHF